MLEGFLDWLWEALSERFRLWAIVIVTLAATGIIISAKIYTASPFLDISSDISKLLLTAIVASVVLKILVLEGYFRTTLSQLLYEDKGLERLTSDGQKAVWRKLTILVYAPFLHHKGRLKEDEDLLKLSGNLTNAVTSQFTYNQNSYHKECQRTYYLKWDTGSEGKIIVMTEIFRSKIIPFKASEPVDWVTTRVAEAHLNIGDYHINERVLKINGHDPDPNLCKREIDGNSERCTYKLYGHDKYSVYRERDIKWYIDSDPGYWMEVVTIIDGGHVEVINNSDTLQIVIKEVGGTNIFSSSDEPVIGYNGRYFGDISSILLPGQGFQLTFIRQKEAPKTAT